MKMSPPSPLPFLGLLSAPDPICPPPALPALSAVPPQVQRDGAGRQQAGQRGLGAPPHQGAEEDRRQPARVPLLGSAERQRDL